MPLVQLIRFQRDHNICRKINEKTKTSPLHLPLVNTSGILCNFLCLSKHALLSTRILVHTYKFIIKSPIADNKYFIINDYHISKCINIFWAKALLYKGVLKYMLTCDLWQMFTRKTALPYVNVCIRTISVLHVCRMRYQIVRLECTRIHKTDFHCDNFAVNIFKIDREKNHEIIINYTRVYCSSLQSEEYKSG